MSAELAAKLLDILTAGDTCNGSTPALDAAHNVIDNLREDILILECSLTSEDGAPTDEVLLSALYRLQSRAKLAAALVDFARQNRADAKP